MRGLDALLVPTTVMPAPKIGEDIEVNLEGKKLPTMPTFTKNTNPFNVINYPAITVPAGYSSGRASHRRADSDEAVGGCEIVEHCVRI